jgi:hypothetical protein
MFKKATITTQRSWKFDLQIIYFKNFKSDHKNWKSLKMTKEKIFIRQFEIRNFQSQKWEFLYAVEFFWFFNLKKNWFKGRKSDILVLGFWWEWKCRYQKSNQLTWQRRVFSRRVFICTVIECIGWSKFTGEVQLTGSDMSIIWIYQNMRNHRFSGGGIIN